MVVERDKAGQPGLESLSSQFLLASVKLCRFLKGLKSAFLGVFLQAQHAPDAQPLRVAVEAHVTPTQLFLRVVQTW